MTLRARRGSALILVLMMTLAIAGLSIAAIFMSSSANLLSVFYDREREYRLAAESALELVRSRLEHAEDFALPDTGMVQLLSGEQLTTAAGTPVPRVRVNAYAAVTGDTIATAIPSVTIIAVAFDAAGTRYVRRLDLRRESFSRYAYLVDSFPATETFGPATVNGRVHSNGAWRLTATGNRYRDTVSAVGTITGAGTFDVDSIVGTSRIWYPRDSTYPGLDSLAAAANLSFAPVTGGVRGSRLEFVAYDVDGDGSTEPDEGFVRVFDAAAGVGGDTARLRASPTVYTAINGDQFNWWRDPIVQNQCGAFYLRSGRWHFFPISAHRRPLLKAIIQSTAAGSYPIVYASTSSPRMSSLEDYDPDAVYDILGLPTARCFPAGSPYLMPAERMTDAAGVVTGGVADTLPWGSVLPPSGVLYGGSDTTFTPRSRSCDVRESDGRCTGGSRVDVGYWRAFAGTPLASAPDSVVQSAEIPYLWPLHPPYNSASRGVLSVTAGPVYVSGRIAGPVTLRVAGRVVVVDRLRYTQDPNDPAMAACTDQLGMVATADVLVVDGLTSRVRRIRDFFGGGGVSGQFGGDVRFSLHGALMSAGGTVGVESRAATMGSTAAQLPCPDDGANSTNSNGGCLAVTGGLAMRLFSSTYASGVSYSGFRPMHTPDRCQSAGRRPPFFPLTNRYTFLRSIEVDPAQANTPAKIRALLQRLRGQPL